MRYDIIIVGGGIAGLTLACLLAQKTSLSIAVLEAKSKVSSNRVSAIALSSTKIFESLCVWKEIVGDASPFREIIAWDSAQKGEINFKANEIAESVLGYIIENNVIHDALEKKAKSSQIEIISPVKLINMIEHDDGIELLAEDGRIFKTKLAIAADGANSWLRNQAGISVEKCNYHQHAIVATVKTALPHHEIACQIFLESGPLAFLPLMDSHTSSIVWSLADDEAKRLMNLPAEEFQHQLAKAFEYRLGDVVGVDERYGFPLSSQRTEKYVKSHIALVGDAAHTVHPLAGQGLNMGLLDVKNLVEVIEKALLKQRDFSSLATLRAYERSRKADNFLMMSGIDIIKTLFASDKKSIQHLRSFGLNSVNQIKWLKNIFTQHASRSI